MRLVIANGNRYGLVVGLAGTNGSDGLFFQRAGRKESDAEHSDVATDNH